MGYYSSASPSPSLWIHSAVLLSVLRGGEGEPSYPIPLSSADFSIRAAEANTQGPSQPKTNWGGGVSERREWFKFTEEKNKISASCLMKGWWRPHGRSTTNLEGGINYLGPGWKLQVILKEQCLPQSYHGSRTWWDEHLLLFNVTSLVVNTIPTSVRLQSIQGALCLRVLLPHSAPAWHAISEAG